LRGTLVFILFFLGHLVFAQEAPTINFSPIGGVYNKPVRVNIEVEEGTTVYYTEDGSLPNSSSTRYREEIEIEKVGVIRAIAYKNGKRSEIITQSYFCDREYSLPIISIATNPENLWDYTTGIYVKGCCADTIEPYLGANFWKDWEKRANIEMYETDGSQAFNQRVGINLFGGFSRMLPQKSLAIFARKKYGENRINYPIFPEREIKKYKSFILRNSGGDFRRTHFRDAFMTQLAKPSGVAVQAYRPAIVFLNGEYWGIQNMREKISEHYLKSNFGTDKENVDILRHNGVARQGTSRNYKKLLAFLRNKDLSKDAVLEELESFMDVTDFLRYNIAEVYSDNRDAGGNIRYWRERTDSAKWRWVFYDLDLGLGNNKPNGYKRNTLKKFTTANAEAWPDPAWSTFIIRRLLSNKSVETDYINMFADQLNTIYSKETALKLIDEMQEKLKQEMPYHVKKWKTSYENWEYHVNIMRKFIQNRPKYLREHLMEKFDLEKTVEVNIEYPQRKDIAKIKFNTLKIEEDYSGIYFSGIPITIEVETRHDYEFIGWWGRDETSATLTITPNNNVALEPIFRAKDRSIYKDSIIINEIAMFQVENDSSGDWIELYNGSSNTIDVGNWGFTKKSYKKRFIIPENTKINANEFLVIARKKENYEVKYNTDTIEVIGDFNFGLSKEKEQLRLYDNQGLIVDSLTYEYSYFDTAYTVGLVHPDSSRSNFNYWKKEDPSPGGKNQNYEAFLKHETDKTYWKKIYYIGGGSFFFILVGGLLLRRSSKRRKKKKLKA